MNSIKNLIEKVKKMEEYHVIKLLFDTISLPLDRIEEFDSNKYYFRDQIIHIFDPINSKHMFYTCDVDVLPPGEFDKSKWKNPNIDIDKLNDIFASINDLLLKTQQLEISKLNKEDNAVTASKLKDSRTITLSGDIKGSTSFDGSQNVDIVVNLEKSDVVPGSYAKVVVNEKGIVVEGFTLSPEDIPGIDWSKIISGKPTKMEDLGILDAVNRSYVDGLIQGLKERTSVTVATTSNVSLFGLKTIDGIQVSVGDTVLVKDQINPIENGIYVVSETEWTRSPEYDENDEFSGSVFIFIKKGSKQGNSGWVCSTNDNFIIGTDPLSFTQFSGAVDSDKIVSIIDDINAIKTMIPSMVRAQMLHVYPSIKDSILLNTSTLMEYSVNSSNGFDGTWQPCDFPNTTIQFPYEEHKVYVREKGNIANNLLVVWIEAPRPAPDVYIFLGDEFTPPYIQRVDETMEYSLDNGLTWNNFIFVNGINNPIQESGELVIRYKATELTLQSATTPMVFYYV